MEEKSIPSLSHCLADSIGANTLQQQVRFLSCASRDALPVFFPTKALYTRIDNFIVCIQHFPIYCFSQKQALLGHRSSGSKGPREFLLTFLYTQEITSIIDKIIPTLVSTPEEPGQEPGAGSHDSDRDRFDPSIEAAIQELRSRVDAFALPDKLHFVAHMNRDARPTIIGFYFAILHRFLFQPQVWMHGQKSQINIRINIVFVLIFVALFNLFVL